MSWNNLRAAALRAADLLDGGTPTIAWERAGRDLRNALADANPCAPAEPRPDVGPALVARVEALLVDLRRAVVSVPPPTAPSFQMGARVRTAAVLVNPAGWPWPNIVLAKRHAGLSGYIVGKCSGGRWLVDHKGSIGAAPYAADELRPEEEDVHPDLARRLHGSVEQRSRQNIGTLPEICLDLRMAHNGSADPMPDKKSAELIGHLRTKLDNWKPSDPFSERFDDCVKQLVIATLREVSASMSRRRALAVSTVNELREQIRAYEGGDRPPSPPARLLREIVDAEQTLAKIEEPSR